MPKEPTTPSEVFSELLEENEPQALAWVHGNASAPYLSGLIKFFETHYGGVLVEAEMFGLPDPDAENPAALYAIHIQEYSSRSRQPGTPDANDGHTPDADGNGQPLSAARLLPLSSCQGYAWLSLYEKRLTLPEIIGAPITILLLRDAPASLSSDSQEIGRGTIRRSDAPAAPQTVETGCRLGSWAI